MFPQFGLENAPISRALVLACASCSLLIKPLRTAQQPLLLGIASGLGFRRRVDAVIGVSILFTLGRILERRRGSRTFGAHLAAAAGMVAACRSLLGIIGWPTSAAVGPISLIATLFVPFAVNVPPVHRISFFSLSLTDKVFAYSLGLNLLVNDYQRALPAVYGILVGVLQQVDPLDINSHLKLPRWCISLLGGPHGRPVIKTAGSSPAQRQEAPQQQGAAPHTAVQVSPQAVEQVAAMGFSEASARRALQQVGGTDVAAAIATLL